MIRVYYKVGATKTFENANGWTIDESQNLYITRDDGDGEAVLIAVVHGHAWETVVDADLVEAKFPSPPKQYEGGVHVGGPKDGETYFTHAGEDASLAHKMAEGSVYGE